MPEPDAAETESLRQAQVATESAEVRPADVEQTNAAGSHSEPTPQLGPNAVTWTLDGFLPRLVQVNTLMERHGAEIAELLANRISPSPDIAIVRSTLAHLGEPATPRRNAPVHDRGRVPRADPDLRRTGAGGPSIADRLTEEARELGLNIDPSGEDE